MTSTVDQSNAPHRPEGTGRQRLRRAVVAVGIAGIGSLRSALVSVGIVAALMLSVARAQSDDQLAPPLSALVWTTASDDGSPLFLYYSPHEGDRGDVLDPNTPLLVLSDELEGDGRRWLAVRTPDDLDGYVPLLSVTQNDPNAAT